MFDFTRITLADKANYLSSADLRLLDQENGRFRVSDAFMADNGLNTQFGSGLTIGDHPDGPVLLVGPEDVSQIMKTRVVNDEPTNKGSEFTSKTLRDFVRKHYTSALTFDLQQVAEHDGYTVFLITPDEANTDEAAEQVVSLGEQTPAQNVQEEAVELEYV